MLFDSMKIGRLDEEAQPSAYPRRRIIKACLLIGAVVGIAMKAGAAAPLRALDEQQVETVRDRQRRSMMPLARIDLSKDAPPERVRVVSEAIYHAMVEVANVPLHDKFQVVTRHAPDEIIYPEEGYLGLNYTRDLIIIQITWVSGRSVDVKKKFFHRIADEIHEKAHVRKEDIWINLVDTNREDWSFGDGEMQYAPK
ncbi:Tautomerase enzyme [Bradyrhizobium erythrophlei]|uniref:Tautomerase enzyme n=2 Tax=Bradyrhizobium erythrophlei TaxID=1437360 RepID=A0A1M5XW76_9BRAD|nr:Tautomerase enzyme [Bradyrhizobium erythrophlei]